MRVLPHINIEKINNFIDSIDCMIGKRKEFYKKIIRLRYNIIKAVYDQLNKL